MRLLGGEVDRAATATPVAAARRRAPWWAWLLAWLAFVPVTVIRAGSPNEGDTSREVRKCAHQGVRVPGTAIYRSLDREFR